MPKTFISIRVSTKEQSADGTSLATQVRECLAYARLHNLELHPDSNCNSPGVFADPGVSAWKCRLLERPGFHEIWRRVEPGDSVIFLSLDRGFRSVRDFADSMAVMQEKGIEPHFVRGGIRMDSASGRLWATVCAAFAEYQSGILSERVRESNAIRRQKQRERAESGVEMPSTLAGPTVRGENTVISDDIRRICGISLGRRANQVHGRVFVYARVSTDDQNPQTQVQILERHAAFYREQGYSEGGVFVDHGVSAYYSRFQDRPAGGELWNQLRPGDLVIVVRVDRIFRSTIDMGLVLQEWEERQIAFADVSSGFVTNTVGGRAMANFLCMMAQWESESISWRCKLAYQDVKERRGPWNSRLPRWVERKPMTLSNGQEIVRLQVIPERVSELLYIRRLVDEGLTANEIGDVLQREHEEREGMPIHVPRSGLGNRHSIEQKMRRRDEWDALKQFRQYCDRFGVGMTDRIDRIHTVEDSQLKRLVDVVRDEDGMFNRYMAANGEGMVV